MQRPVVANCQISTCVSLPARPPSCMLPINSTHVAHARTWHSVTSSHHERVPRRAEAPSAPSHDAGRVARRPVPQRVIIIVRLRTTAALASWLLLLLLAALLGLARDRHRSGGGAGGGGAGSAAGGRLAWLALRSRSRGIVFEADVEHVSCMLCVHAHNHAPAYHTACNYNAPRTRSCVACNAMPCHAITGGNTSPRLPSRHPAPPAPCPPAPPNPAAGPSAPLPHPLHRRCSDAQCPALL